ITTIVIIVWQGDRLHTENVSMKISHSVQIIHHRCGMEEAGYLESVRPVRHHLSRFLLRAPVPKFDSSHQKIFLASVTIAPECRRSQNARKLLRMSSCRYSEPHAASSTLRSSHARISTASKLSPSVTVSGIGRNWA